MYQIIFFVPPESANTVKRAIFKAGGGRLGNYDCCSWETSGAGQFRPLPGSNPSIGTTLKLAKTKELRVEMVCPDDSIKKAVAALLKSHPYEEPAYHLIKILTSSDIKYLKDH